jgi:hypothetical protein
MQIEDIHREIDDTWPGFLRTLDQVSVGAVDVDAAADAGVRFLSSPEDLRKLHQLILEFRWNAIRSGETVLEWLRDREDGLSLVHYKLLTHRRLATELRGHPLDESDRFRLRQLKEDCEERCREDRRIATAYEAIMREVLARFERADCEYS